MNIDLRVIIATETPLDVLMVAKCQLTDMLTMYESYNYAAPEWAITKLEAVNAEIDVKIRAEKLRKLRNLKNLRETLKTKTERRAEADTEIEALEADLAGN